MMSYFYPVLIWQLISSHSFFLKTNKYWSSVIAFYAELRINWGIRGILFLIMNHMILNAQQHAQFNFRHFGVNDGLPSSEVYRIAQDKDGYLWFATDRGLCQFDGREIQVYTTLNGVCDNVILTLNSRQDGSLFMSGFNGAFSSYHNGIFKTYTLSDSAKKALINSQYYSTIFTKNDESFYIFQADMQKHLCYYFSPQVKLDSIRQQAIDAIHFDSNNVHSIFVKRSDLGINSVNVFYNQQLIAQVPYPQNAQNYIHSAALIAKLNGGYLIVLHDELLFVQDRQIRYKKQLLAEPSSKLCRDKKGNHWLGLHHGKGVVKIPQNLLSDSIQYLLDGYSITSILQDHEQGLWFSSLQDGIFYAHPDQYLSVPSISVVSIHNAGNKILYTLKDHRVYSIPKQNPRLTPQLCFKTANDKPTIYHKGQFFGWTGHGPEHLLQTKNGVINIFSWIRTPIVKDSMLWTAASNELFTFNLNSNTHTIDTLKNRITSLAILPNQQILVGTQGGIVQYDVKTAKRKSLRFKNKALNKGITCLYYTPDSTLFIATNGNGVFALRPQDTLHLTTKDGLASNSVHLIRSDKQKRIWFCSNSGINMLTKNKSNNYHITGKVSSADGLISNEINDLVIDNNHIYAATNKGVSILDISKTDTYNIPIHINRIQINDRDTTQLPYYKLDYKKRRISISLTGISYKASNEILYKYKMIGRNENWIISPTSNINYNLEPGHYRFEAYAGYENGQWSLVPAQFELEITPPFWKTIWFWILVHVLLALVIAGIGRQRNKRQKARTKTKEELTNAKLEALSAQMNPHFIFNSLNSIQALIMNEDKKNATIQIAKFSRLIRSILSNSNHKTVSLKTALDALTIYLELEQQRTKNKFDFTFNIAPEIDASQYHIPSLLLQPFVENAIWHGILPKQDKGHISIQIQEKSQHITCIIQDNGVGRAYHNNRKKLHRSLGVDITTRRIELLNKLYASTIRFEIIDLYEKEKATGTRVLFYIPKIIHSN